MVLEIVASAASLIEVKDDDCNGDGSGDGVVKELWKFGRNGSNSSGGPSKTDHVYYSDASDVRKDSKHYDDSEGQPWSSYFRVRIYTNIVNGKWKPVEEQEVSLNIREFGCKFCKIKVEF